MRTVFFFIAMIFVLFGKVGAAQEVVDAEARYTFPAIPLSIAIPPGWRLHGEVADAVSFVPIDGSEPPESMVVAFGCLCVSPTVFFTEIANLLEEELEIELSDVSLVEPIQTSRDGEIVGGSVHAIYADLHIAGGVHIHSDALSLGAIALARADKLEATLQAAREIDASAQFGELELDDALSSRLVGRWRKSEASNSGNRGSISGGTSSSSDTTYTFFDDRTFNYRYRGMLAIDVPGAGALSSSDTDEAGQFFVLNDRVFFASDGPDYWSLSIREVDADTIQLGNSYYRRQ